MNKTAVLRSLELFRQEIYVTQGNRSGVASRIDDLIKKVDDEVITPAAAYSAGLELFNATGE